MKGVLAVLLLIAVAEAIIPKDGILSKVFAHILHPFHHHGKPEIEQPSNANTNSKDDLEYNYSNVDVSNAEWVCVNPKTKKVKVVTAMELEEEEKHEQNYAVGVSGQSNQQWQGFYTTSRPFYKPAKGQYPIQPNNLPGTEEQSQPNFSSGQDYSDNLNIIPSRLQKPTPNSYNRKPDYSDEDMSHLIDIRRGGMH